ncbi:MAG TPA: hypothetical protein VHU80_11945 [Polyangiaceae bacterium]|nr:hypothetical protein [Polyangiaceae bacterium]
MHLVRELLDRIEVSKGPVLDPFCGTGTTLLACAERGIDCTTVELNPFLVWLAGAKTGRYDGATIDRARELSERMALGAKARSGATIVPGIHRIERWWDPAAIGALGRAAAVERQSDAPERARDLCKLALCRALIETANVSFGHQSMSFREAGATAKTARDVATALERAFEGVAAAARVPLKRSKRTVVAGDSRRVDELAPGKFGAVLTSPPYSNRMSYIRELRPYMYWLGYLLERRDAGELDWRAIGGTWGSATSRLGTWTPDDDVRVAFPDLPRIVRGISTREPLLGKYVHRYFEDMTAHARGLSRVVAPGGHIYYVVGNSKFYDVMLPAHEIFAAIFEAAGFGDCKITELRKRTSKRELFEYLVEATMPLDVQAASSMPNAATPRRRSSRRTSVAPP